jgi:hypothetical protein
MKCRPCSSSERCCGHVLLQELPTRLGRKTCPPRAPCLRRARSDRPLFPRCHKRLPRFLRSSLRPAFQNVVTPQESNVQARVKIRATDGVIRRSDANPNAGTSEFDSPLSGIKR